MNRKVDDEDDHAVEKADVELSPLGESFGLPRPNRALTALTTSALALPGIAGVAGIGGIAGSARAETPIERASASSSFSYYREDKLPINKWNSTTGSRDRYEVFTEQLRFDFPINERFDLGIDFLYEEMSGASPWYVTAGAEGQLLQVMSGATIEDTRYDGGLDLDYFQENGKDTVSGGFSLENDYLSIFAGLGTERNFNDKNTTLSIAGSFAYDFIEPTDADRFGNRISKDEKWSIDLFAGLSQIIYRAATIQFTANYKHSAGFLNDPYKEVAQIAGGNLTDERPDTKDQASFMIRLRQHIEPITASVHADYRLYVDDWGVVSHTAELAWYQNLFGWLTVTPSVRWYGQGKADFYEALLPSGVTPTLRSSDFRLSPYGALSGRLKIEGEWNDLVSYHAPEWLQVIGITEGMDLIVALSYERYFSDGDIGVGDIRENEEAPGLVDFHVMAFTLSGRF